MYLLFGLGLKNKVLCGKKTWMIEIMDIRLTVQKSGLIFWLKNEDTPNTSIIICMFKYISNIYIWAVKSKLMNYSYLVPVWTNIQNKDQIRKKLYTRSAQKAQKASSGVHSPCSMLLIFCQRHNENISVCTRFCFNNFVTVNNAITHTRLTMESENLFLEYSQLLP